MSRANTWTNSDGLSVGFGTRNSKNINSGTVRTQGNVEVLTAILDWDDLPTAATNAASVKSIPVPAGSTILHATLRVIEGFTSGGATTLSIGLKTLAGVDIDADGIDATIAKTAIDAIGEVVRCDGDLVGGTVNIGTADGYLSTVVATGPYTAGKAELTIEYMRPMPDWVPTEPISGIVGTL